MFHILLDANKLLTAFLTALLTQRTQAFGFVIMWVRNLATEKVSREIAATCKRSFDESKVEVNVADCS